MGLLLRYRLVLSIVLVAIAATASFLTFGLRKPGQPNQRTVDLARVHHDSPAAVRTAFAAQGIRLRYESAPGVEPKFLSPTPLPVSEEGVYVMIAPGRGTMSWGPKHAHVYDQPIDNILVHDGGTNARTLAAVEAAVATLRDAGQ